MREQENQQNSEALVAAPPHAEEVVLTSIVEEGEAPKWYIIQCMTGQEFRIRDRILAMVELKGFGHRIFRVLVPEEGAIEIKNNKRVEKVTRIYPGYVFIEMVMDAEIGFELRQLPGVSKFIGSKTVAAPVAEDDILRVLRKVGDKTKKIDVDFEMGETIKIVGGPFRGYSGPISEISPERGKLKALISIFGRETPVELDFDQLEKSV